MAIIYLLTNKLDGKRYVGKTVRSLEVRWQGHVASARREDTDMLVCRAIRKHGADAFEKSVLEECDESVLNERETYWIAELKTHASDGGYNLTTGGDGRPKGYVLSEESKEKMRQKALGRKHDEATKAKMRESAKGRKKSPESVEARAKSNRGKKRTEEQKARISAGLQASGYTHSEETRKKIGEKSRNRVVSDETRAKLRAKGGWHQSDDVKAKVSASRSKAVQQFSVDGDLIAEYTSIKNATAMSGISMPSIQRSLYSGEPKLGFIWKYKGG